jgi:two-component system response regulator ResD
MADNKILVVDDEKRVVDLVKLYLEKEGFEVDVAYDGQQALDMIENQDYTMLILDIMLPIVDGWTVAKEIRKKRDLPIIMLTARGEEFDKVLGFELGADDYVVKPFSPRELMARVKALLRRMNPPAQKSDVLAFPELTIDPTSRTVTASGKQVDLTPKEFDLLYYMAKSPETVFTREKLLQDVWDYSFFGSLRTVDTHIKQLREKLRHCKASKYITTVWGVGYKFEVT